MMYLLPGNYFGIEPEKWLVDEGIDKEVSRGLVELKKPTFSYDSEFQLTTFGRTFDYLVAQSIFSHATKRQIMVCLEEARKVMTPSSVFIATFKVGKRDWGGSKWNYPNTVPYTLATINRLVEEQGLVCTASDWPHLYNQTWFTIKVAEVK